MYDKLIKEIDVEIELLKRSRFILDTKIPELVDLIEGNAIVTERGLISFTMPYILKSYNENVDRLVNAGWVKDGIEWINPNNGVMIQSFRFVINEHEDVKLSIQLWPNYAGSTCKVKKIGTEEWDIVEVVCNEAVND